MRNVENQNFVIHQINTIVGDIYGNTDKIIKALENSEPYSIHIFPETAITGYLCGALYDRLEFIKDAENAEKRIIDYINRIEDCNGIVVIFGNITYHGINRSGFPILKNSAVCITRSPGEYSTIQYYHKQLLANYDHHEDRKYFKKGDETIVFDIKLSKHHTPFKIGVPVCEDSWFNDHTRNIPEEMVKMGADIIISINQSYFNYGKQLKKMKMFGDIAKHNNVKVIMVNNIGCGDVVKNIISYNGGSVVFDETGKLVKQLPVYEQCHSSFSFSEISKNNINGIKPTENVNINFNKYEEIRQSLIYTQKQFFELQGIERAQVHLSGGLDSSIVAYLVVEAMSKDDVIFISNPSSCNGNETKSNAQHTADILGVKLYWNPIEEIYQTLKRVDDESFEGCDTIPKAGLSSMQAVLRSVQALSANHRFSSGLVSCGNHTENVLGWASFHDVGSIGVLQLIGDLSKVELFELAAYINKKEGKMIIPEDLYNGKLVPKAELPDADEDNIDYYVQSGICVQLVRERKGLSDIMFEFNNKILNQDYYPDYDAVYRYSYEDFKKQVEFAINKMKRSVYKNAQSAPVVVISPRSRGFSNRETLINRYNK